MEDAILEPALPIVDPHHHLYARNHWADNGPYLLREFASDLGSGHNVQATVYVECGNFNRLSGPEHLRSTGEAAFATVIGRLADTGIFGPARVAQGIIAHVDLRLGDHLEEVLWALHAASEGRVRGIRSATVWDADTGLAPGGRSFAPQGLMADPAFRAGVAQLQSHGLVYDAWQFYPQLDELCDLADALPNSQIICGHCGGLVGKNAYAGPENFGRWRSKISALAQRPNVMMKLGGLAHERNGFGFRSKAEKPSADALVSLWRPYIESCIEAFGAERCMFESNYPVDGVAADYRTLWTVFKRIAAGCSDDEKANLFAGTARRAYRLD